MNRNEVYASKCIRVMKRHVKLNGPTVEFLLKTIHKRYNKEKQEKKASRDHNQNVMRNSNASQYHNISLTYFLFFFFFKLNVKLPESQRFLQQTLDIHWK